METTNQIHRIRSLMPDLYLNKLSELTGYTPSYISRVVNQEKVTSKIWPQVLELAQEEVKRRSKLQETTQKLKAIVC